ncbi:MAG: hypothetical protein OEN01_00995 [Candidatus Krumholzibacteria bacterium]|nr:hypothetical protein [Candidatus Krumholzibacteria bacterium]
MPTARIILGFLLAPLMTPLTFTLAGPFAFGESPLSWDDWLLGPLLLTGPFAYVIALVLGVPAYFVLRSRGWLTLRLVSLLGATAGVLAGLLIAGDTFVPLITVCALAGGLSAVVFWMIAGRRVTSHE